MIYDDFIELVFFDDDIDKPFQSVTNVGAELGYIKQTAGCAQTCLISGLVCLHLPLQDVDGCEIV